MDRLLDSNILIYAAQEENSFLDGWISPATAQVSAISIPEVLGFPGLSAVDEALFEDWFSVLFVHAVTESVLRQASALRRQQRMKLGDSIVAATAMVTASALVTRNVDDFKHIPGLQLINPFEKPTHP